VLNKKNALYFVIKGCFKFLTLPLFLIASHLNAKNSQFDALNRQLSNELNDYDFKKNNYSAQKDGEQKFKLSHPLYCRSVSEYEHLCEVCHTV
jgi:hypothetical protein